jgi:hypothetical protein
VSDSGNNLLLGLNESASGAELFVGLARLGTGSILSAGFDDPASFTVAVSAVGIAVCGLIVTAALSSKIKRTRSKREYTREKRK